MRAKLEEMKGPARVGTVVSLRSALGPANRSADGSAVRGAVHEIKTQTADPVWYHFLPPDTARCIVERRRAL